MDDFGVAHSSVSRLMKLSPAHVKVDRSLLQSQCASTAIRFVIDMANTATLHPPKIIVEGFDGRSALTLAQLYKIGVRRVQGHLIGKASRDLLRLDQNTRNYLEGLIQSEARMA
jgi:EAL domain-containing protein (putative c-di-GMP-specific phosphodiesterase class I)